MLFSLGLGTSHTKTWQKQRRMSEPEVVKSSMTSFVS